jgi:HPt (histidine-containing phosphotransfer) domain-containing protein
MAELIEQFVRELSTRVDSVEEAYRTRDIDGLKRLAHQLKRAADGHGFPAVGTAAGAIEHTIKSASDRTATLTTLGQEVKELLELCRRATTTPNRVNTPRRV